MRCPKCHYLSFDPEPRCRNCGYGLSLEDDDLFIREEATEAPASPFAEVNLRDAADVPLAAVSAKHVVISPEPSTHPSLSASMADGMAFSPSGDVSPAEKAAVFLPPSPSRPRPAPTTELPLFVRGMSAAAAPAVRLDEPLLQVPEEPRPPLSVRRAVPEPAPQPAPAAERLHRRVPVDSKTKGPLDRDLLSDLQRSEALEALEHRARSGAQAEATRASVGAGPRLAAAAIDGTVLGALSLTVMWLTLRWCDLPLDRALMLPVLIPTSVFLALVGVGYLVMFNAAGGQTLGKMALGLRVVREVTPFDAGGPVSLGQAMLRAVVTIPSVLAAGAGFLPALIGDHRAVHDRLAQTRVVRA